MTFIGQIVGRNWKFFLYDKLQRERMVGLALTLFRMNWGPQKDEIVNIFLISSISIFFPLINLLKILHWGFEPRMQQWLPYKLRIRGSDDHIKVLFGPFGPKIRLMLVF